LAAHLRSARHDVVVAVAGGSVLNCAKAAACLAAGDLSSIRAVHSEGVPQGKIDKHGFGPAHVAAACRRLTAEKH
jgi:alcohol dehydrogenase class IV